MGAGAGVRALEWRQDGDPEEFPGLRALQRAKEVLAWSAKEAEREAAEKKAGKRPEVKTEPIEIDSDDSGEAYLAYFSDLDD